MDDDRRERGGGGGSTVKKYPSSSSHPPKNRRDTGGMRRPGRPRTRCARTTRAAGDYDYTDHPDLIYGLALQLLLLYARGRGETCGWANPNSTYARGDVIFAREREAIVTHTIFARGWGWWWWPTNFKCRTGKSITSWGWGPGDIKKKKIREKIKITQITFACCLRKRRRNRSNHLHPMHRVLRHVHRNRIALGRRRTLKKFAKGVHTYSKVFEYPFVLK